MNRPSYDEYEEVESPFAARSTEKSTPRDRLRTRKNVFNRPFATEATSAPLIVETKSTRRSIGRADINDIVDFRSTDLAETEIEYLDEDEDEEEEIVERRPSTRSSAKKKSNTKTNKNLLPKIAWSVVGLLVLRLICMDRGVWDYFATEGAIREKKSELNSIYEENKTLKTEISRIQVDKNYQRHLAKDHLGVIAGDEFLVLFAAESVATEDESNPASL
jgi:cell division protein FtsB